MTQTSHIIDNVNELEQALKRQKAPLQRLVLIDKLTAHYIYTNVRFAQKLLGEQDLILKEIENEDFLLNYHWHSAVVANQFYQFTKAEDHFITAIEMLLDRGAAVQQAEAYIDYAGTCMNLKNLDTAEDCLEKAGKLLKSFPDEGLFARLICRQGYMNLHFANYSQAVSLLLDADKRMVGLTRPLSLKDYYFLTLIHAGLGRIYEQNDELRKSVNAYQKVVNICEAMEIRTRLSWHYLNAGSVHLALNDYINAEPFFRKAIDTSDDISEYAKASAYANLGYCFYESKNYEKALELFDRADALFKEYSPEDFNNFSILEAWRGMVHEELLDNKGALDHFLQALEYAKLSNNNKRLSSVCKDIASFYADLEDYKNAYEFQLLYEKYGEAFREEVEEHKELELEIKYEAERKAQETKLLRLEATKLQLKALRAQMNPHFMYNALNAIQNYITSQNVDSAAKYLAKFAHLMRQSLEYSDLEIISLEKEIEFLENYLEINQKLRFENQLTHEIIIDEEIEEDILGVPTMIVQPYVENAIEHGLRSKENGHIKLIFALFDEDTILCIVEDNGIGRKKARQLRMKDPEYQNYRSRGTTITEERLKILNRSKNPEVFVETIDLKDLKTGEALGTRVRIKIPIVEIKLK